MYKRGHAVTYLLLKESVANNVINVSLFAYDKIMLKTLNVNKRTQDILVKNVRESKKYGVRRLRNFQTRNGASVVWRTF